MAKSVWALLPILVITMKAPMIILLLMWPAVNAELAGDELLTTAAVSYQNDTYNVIIFYIIISLYA